MGGCMEEVSQSVGSFDRLACCWRARRDTRTPSSVLSFVTSQRANKKKNHIVQTRSIKASADWSTLMSPQPLKNANWLTHKLKLQSIED